MLLNAAGNQQLLKPTCMLILQGTGEFRASLISSATAYHPQPESRGDGGGRDAGKIGGWGANRKVKARELKIFVIESSECEHVNVLPVVSQEEKGS